MSRFCSLSRSGFSYLAAELGDAVCIAAPFWHTFSRTEAVVYADKDTADFDSDALRNMLKRRRAGLYAS